MFENRSVPFLTLEKAYSVKVKGPAIASSSFLPIIVLALLRYVVEERLIGILHMDVFSGAGIVLEDLTVAEAFSSSSLNPRCKLSSEIDSEDSFGLEGGCDVPGTVGGEGGGN